MELQQLKYFKTVAEMGKISDAAQALFVSAPAVSTSIARLEEELDTTLFDRTNNRIILNRQGQIFLRYVNQIFTSLDCAKTELRHSTMLQGQNVSIASVSSTQWVDMITAFSQEHPHFTLSCTSVKRQELVTNGLSDRYTFLLAGEDDIPLFYQGELESMFLFEERPVIMVHNDHPFARRTEVELSEILNETIFLPMEDYTLYEQLVKLFEGSSIPLPAGNAYSHLATQEMVSQGLGIVFATLHTAKSAALPIKYVSIRDRYEPWFSRLYWRKNHIFTDDEKCFKDFIGRYYQSNPM